MLRVIRTRWVTVNKGSDNVPQSSAWWVAQEFRGRCGDKHEYFSETHDSVKVAIRTQFGGPRVTFPCLTFGERMHGDIRQEIAQMGDIQVKMEDP